MPWWGIRAPWNTCLAADEFGNGTLDGNPNDGPAFDGCGPAAAENGRANLENRVPTYSNMGQYRGLMIQAGQWTEGATVANPRTNGCFIENVAWLINQWNGYQALDLHPDTGHVFSAAEVYSVLLAYHAYSIWLVTDAQMLSGNERGVRNHFVGVAAYGGDNPDGTPGMIYVLNSDIAGQHGLATGQWMTIAAFCEAQPMGYVVLAKRGSAPPVIEIEHNAAGAIIGAKDTTNGNTVGAGIANEINAKGQTAATLATPEIFGLSEHVSAAVLRGADKLVYTWNPTGNILSSYGGDVVDVVDDLYQAMMAAAAKATPPVDNSQAIADLKHALSQLEQTFTQSSAALSAAIGEVK